MNRRSKRASDARQAGPRRIRPFLPGDYHINEEIVALPLFNEITPEEAGEVIDAVRECFDGE